MLMEGPVGRLFILTVTVTAKGWRKEKWGVVLAQERWSAVQAE